jgi:uncharacterized protein
VHVAELHLAPVKGLRLVAQDAVELTAAGPRGDRAFFVRQAGGRIATTTRHAALTRVVPRVADERLALDHVEAEVVLGEPVVTRFYDGRRVGGRVVEGPFAAYLSDLLGKDVQLVARDEDEVGGDDGPVTLVGAGSVDALGEHLGAEVGSRRFRMTITVAGAGPWAEHGWGEVSVGDALLRVAAPTVRCVVTTRDPDTGERDHPVTRALAQLHGKDHVECGVWCDVLRPGRVAVGDPVSPTRR